MQKILLFTATLFLSGIVAFGQCANSGSTFGFATAPSIPGTTTQITTCNFYGEAATVDGFLSSMMYTLEIADGGFVTVFDATLTAVGSGSVPYTFMPPADGTYYLQWNGAGCSAVLRAICLLYLKLVVLTFSSRIFSIFDWRIFSLR